MWYFSICDRVEAAYFRAMAMAHIRRATLPITVYSGSIPFEKKKERLGAKLSIGMPRDRKYSRYVNPLASVNASWVMGLAPASAIWYPEMETE